MAVDNTINQPDNEPPFFQIVHIYLKDLSFENPDAPESLKIDSEPKISMDLDTKASQLEDNLRQVALNVTIKLHSNDDEKTLYIVEIEYAAIVQTEGFSDDETRRILGVSVPNILFPYIRETADSIVLKAGFAPLRLAPINFDALFAEAMAQEQQKNVQTH